MSGFFHQFGQRKAKNEGGHLTPEPYEPQVRVEDVFYQRLVDADRQRVLEVGTLQAVPGRSTHSMSLFPSVQPKNYVRLDIIDGPDVDVVGDLHKLPNDWNNRFDCFVAHAVFEHLERPWIAAKEVARVLAPGGRFLVKTHQCFPIHGYPSDFFRFSDAALRLIFEDAGLVVDACGYDYRCMIIPPKEIVPEAHLSGWNKEFPSYIHVGATGYKPIG
ncbi:class I SAM-dependent methyltransferase [Rhizobium deserti]|uniref:Class I SAM-dependent methyltransferase n=1 Tax=Rhizobium deserti TaxID=2547961 RepID=A0A4R5UMN7_9HYPH|nr:methyltransferase domain-containing protein [Rhizobium deserti]TDK39136.1 class I SAM-dependent methyltransferase [Rhizobium deserti]